MLTFTSRFFLYFVSTLVLASVATQAVENNVDFNRDIRPILSNKCFACHGPDENALQAGLRLDNVVSATLELESGNVALVPGQPDESELVARITSDDIDERMPPEDFGKTLSPAEIDIVRKWVEQGGKYARHWSYVKPTRPESPPATAPHESWPINAIDHFTLHRMVQNDLKPSTNANRYTLIRRIYLDLIGLPPTIEEVDAFVNDPDPKAYEQLVDKLLRQPSFGEHWARKWLDLARYADSAGYADDPPRTIWAYRDWVIRSLNENVPFDQFTIEQLAADLLPEPDERQLIATAFHRNTLTNNEGGTQNEEFRNVAVVDRVNTTMTVWMGTTMACAQCHNHKFDPISQEEYFRFFAVWNSTQDADLRDESPRIQIFTDKQKLQKTDLTARVAELQNIIAQDTPELIAAQDDWENVLRQPAKWTPRTPRTVNRKGELSTKILKDGFVLVEVAAEKDTYTIDLPVGDDASKDQATAIAALRLETLPHESLPAKGTGLGGGNFVITGLKAQIVPDGDSPPSARFIRITNNGVKQILSLAEVQIFSGGDNVARTGVATQHSTAFAGPPELAIDGNTDGTYEKTSVTHTDTVDNPWWEVDLAVAVSIDRIAIWNRTDNNLHTRLKNFTITLLDTERQPVWEQVIAAAPNPSAEYSPTNIRDILFRTAFADYHQDNFDPTDVLSGKTAANDGWAIGGETNVPHQLILVPDKPLTLSEAATLRVHIEQNSVHKNHLLGHFRLSTTQDRVAIDRSRLPADLLAVVDMPAMKRTPEQSSKLSAHYRENVAEALRSERRELVKSQKTLAEMKPATSVPILRELAVARETRLQFRGNYLDKGDVVEVGLPAAFHAAPDDAALNRLTLAKWLMNDNNPLTARVITNRYWETLFGRGIVLTSEEFGSQGELPTHPQLLDWLATELVGNGWDTKSLIRTIVTSATYRQSAQVNQASLDADFGNVWLSRGPRVRLSAEMVRDQALFASGLLSDKMFGPPVKPPQPSFGLTAAFGSSTDWKTSEGQDRYRRGIYTTWRRSNPYPSMVAFDAPNREVCTVRRSRTNTPLQSLVTLNDPVYVEAAQSLARRALQHEGTLSEQIAHAFRCCVARPPTEIELKVIRQLYEDAKAHLAEQEGDAMKLATDPLGALPAGMTAIDAAAMTVVGNVLLNLDEMFLKR
jgi:hypothetical protein